MESRIVSCLIFFCILQAIAIMLLASCTYWLIINQTINAKVINPLWNVVPFGQTMDPDLNPIVNEIKLRLSQAQSISKSAINMNLGLASKNIGLTTSQAKISIKSAMTNVQNNPNVTKDCLSLHKDDIDLVNTESKDQLNFCSKGSQIQLKTLNQVQKQLSYQAASINNDLNLAVSQCQLTNPLPTDKPALIECVSNKTEELKDRVTAFEQSVLEAISAIDSNIQEIVGYAKLCLQEVEEYVRQEADAIAEDLQNCTNMTVVA